jgi:hypothetical protein
MKTMKTQNDVNENEHEANGGCHHWMHLFDWKTVVICGDSIYRYTMKNYEELRTLKTLSSAPPPPPLHMNN